MNIKVCQSNHSSEDRNDHIKIFFNNRNEKLCSDSNYFRSENSSSKNTYNEVTFKKSNSTNADLTNLPSNGSDNYILNSNKKIKNGIFKSTNFANRNQSISSNIPMNFTQSKQINPKGNSNIQKKIIFNSTPTYTHSIKKNFSSKQLEFEINNDNSHNNNFEYKLLKNNTNPGLVNNSIEKNFFLPTNVNNELNFLDPQQNLSLNKYLENSINYILINFFSKGAQIDIKNQGIIEQSNLNNLQKTNENKTDFNPQLDFVNYIENINNYEQNDSSNNQSNFGNIILNSLIEAYKQNNYRTENNNNIKLNQDDIFNKFQFGVKIDIDKPIYHQDNIKKFALKSQEGYNYIRVKRKRKINSNTASHTQSLKKPKFISTNYKNKNKFNLPNNNYAYSINDDYTHNGINKIRNQNLFIRNNNQNQNLNLSLNDLQGENMKKNNNNVYYANEDSFSVNELNENHIIQKSGRIIKKNKFYDSKSYETDHVKKSKGRKRKNINSNHMISNDYKDVNYNPNQSGNYSDNEHDQSPNILYSPYLIPNQNIFKNFKNQAETHNNNVNIYEEMKFQRRLENENNYSNRQIEYENPYNLNMRTNNLDEKMMKFPYFNLGNLGAKYVFTPNDQSEMTFDLYNQDFQVVNNMNSAKSQSIDKNDTNIVKRSFYNYQIDNKYSNLNSGKIIKEVYKSSNNYNPFIVSEEGNNISNRKNIKKTCCKHSRPFKEINDKVIFPNREINSLNYSRFSNESDRHSHSGFCKDRKRDKNSANNLLNIKHSSKFTNENMFLINPIEKEINEEENLNNDQECIELPENYLKNKFEINAANIYRKFSDYSLIESSTFINNCNSAFKNLNLNRIKTAFDNKGIDMNSSNNNFEYNNSTSMKSNMHNTINFNNNNTSLNNGYLNDNNSISKEYYNPLNRISLSNNITSNNHIPNENCVNKNFKFEEDSKNSDCCKSKKNVTKFDIIENQNFAKNTSDIIINKNSKCCKLNSLKSSNSQNYPNFDNDSKENKNEESNVLIEERKDSYCKCNESSFQKRLPSVQKNENIAYQDLNSLEIQDKKVQFNNHKIISNNKNNDNNNSLITSTLPFENPTCNSDNLVIKNIEGNSNKKYEQSYTNKNEEEQEN